MNKEYSKHKKDILHRSGSPDPQSVKSREFPSVHLTLGFHRSVFEVPDVLFSPIYGYSQTPLESVLQYDALLVDCTSNML